MIKVADSYALGDPTQPAFAADPVPRYPLRQDFRNNHHKRREDFSDRRYVQQHVTAVQQDQPEAGGSQRQKTCGQPWNGQKKQWAEKKPWQDNPK
jgi:hypothetical protein